MHKKHPIIFNAEKKEASRAYVKDSANPFAGRETKIEPITERKSAKKALAALKKADMCLAELEELGGLEQQRGGLIYSELLEMCDGGRIDPQDIMLPVFFRKSEKYGNKEGIGMLLNKEYADKAAQVENFAGMLGEQAKSIVKIIGLQQRMNALVARTEYLISRDTGSSFQGVCTKRQTDISQLKGIDSQLASRAMVRALSLKDIINFARRSAKLHDASDEELEGIFDYVHAGVESTGGTLADVINEFMGTVRDVYAAGKPAAQAQQIRAGQALEEPDAKVPVEDAASWKEKKNQGRKAQEMAKKANRALAAFFSGRGSRWYEKCNGRAGINKDMVCKGLAEISLAANCGQTNAANVKALVEKALSELTESKNGTAELMHMLQAIRSEMDFVIQKVYSSQKN